MQTFENFKVAQDGSIVTVTMSRPEAFNTMTKTYWKELPEVFRYAESLTDARVIILNSTGKHFCAGMDLSIFAAPDQPSTNDHARAGEGVFRSATRLQECISTLEQLRVPVLCAIQGGCIGGAVDLVTAADLRYSTKDAFFCIQETNIGITADVGTLQRLPKLIPEAAAREMAYTGRRIDGVEAQQMGIVTRAYDTQEELDAAVLDVAKTIASKSPLVITGIKTAINFTRDHSVDSSLKMIAAWNSGLISGHDMKASMSVGKGEAPQYDQLTSTQDKWS